MSPDVPELLAFAVDTAHAAGEVVLRHDGRLPRSDARMKGERDPVTVADLESEREIVARIRARFPDMRIHAEEETRDAVGEGPTWYVDPLDGTVNFAQAHPFFAVSIALYDGPEPLVGVVHAPRLKETFAAGRGLGATLDGTPLSVSHKERLLDAVLATGFGYRRHELLEDNVRHFTDFVLRVRGLRRCGSAALDLAYTAAGRLDGFWEPHLNPFDVAAGALLVREAGGLVTDMTGGDAWLHGRHICAAGPALHRQMLDVLAEAPVLVGRDCTPDTPRPGRPAGGAP